MSSARPSSVPRETVWRNDPAWQTVRWEHAVGMTEDPSANHPGTSMAHLVVRLRTPYPTDLPLRYPWACGGQDRYCQAHGCLSMGYHLTIRSRQNRMQAWMIERIQKGISDSGFIVSAPHMEHGCRVIRRVGGRAIIEGTWMVITSHRHRIRRYDTRRECMQPVNCQRQAWSDRVASGRNATSAYGSKIWNIRCRRSGTLFDRGNKERMCGL